MTYDVITIGETMLRLTPPDLLRIEQASNFDAHIGGSESNVAVGLARLGLDVAWISRLTDNTLGHWIVNGIRAQNVDTSHVIWTEENRVGLYFYEEGVAPRGSSVIYDRADSAMAHIRPAELPIGLFQKEKARLLHITGITLAISNTASHTVHEAVKLAKKAGYLLSFDINYRSLLWSTEEAQSACHEIASVADIIFLPLRDAISIYHTPSDPEKAIRMMAERYPNAIIVLTLGANGALALSDTKIMTQSAFPAQEVGRLGGGDAFVAGFLYGYLTALNIQDALLWGTASAAYK